MRFAIVESGGKQYRALEGTTIDVDRLAHDVGKKLDFERVLFMGDEDTFMIGTPAISGILVSATVVEHLRGPKVISFKYRPKKRIRVKGGHRHHYTRLMIDFIGKPAGYGLQVRERYTADRYHKPSDEVTPDWDLSGLAEDVQLLFAVGYRVAQADRYPAWKAGNEFKAIRESQLRKP